MRLWEDKTGVHVELNALGLVKAQEIMLPAGGCDRYEVITLNAQKSTILPNHMQHDVPIFYHKCISGIEVVQTYAVHRLW